MIEFDDLDFAKEPIGFRHGVRTTKGYFSLNAILAKQHDGTLWSFVSNLQTLIARRCTDLKLPILDSPYSKETGLYVYPTHTLHCTLFNDVALQQESYNDVSKLNVDGHPWLNADTSSLAKFEVVPRWFYAYNATKQDDTEGFSLQLFMPRSAFDQLANCFGKPTDYGSEGSPHLTKPKAKVYVRDNCDFVRGVVNLARFLSTEQNANFTADQRQGLQALFKDLNQQVLLQTCWIDRLTCVKSDAWLKQSEIVKEIELG